MEMGVVERTASGMYTHEILCYWIRVPRPHLPFRIKAPSLADMVWSVLIYILFVNVHVFLVLVGRIVDIVIVLIGDAIIYNLGRQGSPLCPLPQCSQGKISDKTSLGRSRCGAMHI